MLEQNSNNNLGLNSPAFLSFQDKKEVSPQGAQKLEILTCDKEVRPSKPEEPVIYRACAHDYIQCGNNLCIKKLV